MFFTFKFSLYSTEKVFTPSVISLSLDFEITRCREPAWGTPPVAKVMRKEPRHTQSQDRASGVPLDILEHLPPKPESAYFTALCFHLWLYGGCPPPPSRSLWKGVNLQLQLIKFLGIIGVFKSKPLRWLSNVPDRFTRTPTAMHTIVYSLPASRGTGSLRYSNSLELRELETVRIRLVKDFIDESMLVAKFSHPLNCMLECVLINIVGI